jgi:hypothetical protein
MITSANTVIGQTSNCVATTEISYSETASMGEASLSVPASA